MSFNEISHISLHKKLHIYNHQFFISKQVAKLFCLSKYKFCKGIIKTADEYLL